MELVAVGVPDEHVAGVRHVNAVGEVGHVLAADATEEPALVVEHYYAVPFEIAHVEFLAWKMLIIGFKTFSFSFNKICCENGLIL